jgi:hypothetical protein
VGVGGFVFLERFSGSDLLVFVFVLEWWVVLIIE